MMNSIDIYGFWLSNRPNSKPKVGFIHRVQTEPKFYVWVRRPGWSLTTSICLGYEKIRSRILQKNTTTFQTRDGITIQKERIIS
jgi:hypothetical protein